MDNTQIEKIKNNLQSWIATIYTSEHTNNPKNLHIDEIKTFNKIERDEWIDDSFFVFKILLKEFKIKKPLVIFLHIDLSYTEKKIMTNKITIKWLKENIGEFTPPSWHCTTLNYYKNFYEKQCIECSVDKALTDFFGTKNKLIYLFRTYFEESENMFSRELYIFSI